MLAVKVIVTEEASEVDYSDLDNVLNYSTQQTPHLFSIFSLFETDNAAIGTYRISAVAFKSAPLLMT